MFTLGRTLLILGFIITAVALCWLVFGSMEFPRGDTIGDLEYKSTAAHYYIPLFVGALVTAFIGFAYWNAKRR